MFSTMPESYRGVPVEKKQWDNITSNIVKKSGTQAQLGVFEN